MIRTISLAVKYIGAVADCATALYLLGAEKVAREQAEREVEDARKAEKEAAYQRDIAIGQRDSTYSLIAQRNREYVTVTDERDAARSAHATLLRDISKAREIVGAVSTWGPVDVAEHAMVLEREIQDWRDTLSNARSILGGASHMTMVDLATWAASQIEAAKRDAETAINERDAARAAGRILLADIGKARSILGAAKEDRAVDMATLAASRIESSRRDAETAQRDLDAANAEVVRLTRRVDALVGEVASHEADVARLTAELDLLRA